MGLWKDKKRKDWCYKFQIQKKTYGSRGYSTKKEAIAARAEHRRKVLESIGQTPKSMGFREVASIYLDDAQRRFVTKTYKYKVSVYKAFLEYHGDMPIDKITPVIVDSYLKTRETNNNYNAHRKELSALFTYARDHLQVITHNPVLGIDKLPHTAARKVIPSEKNVVHLLETADPIFERPFLLCSISKKTISEILGHKSLTTTEIYLHSIGDSQVAAMKGLEGRFSNGESKTATDNRHQKTE